MEIFKVFQPLLGASPSLNRDNKIFNLGPSGAKDYMSGWQLPSKKEEKIQIHLE